MKRAISALLCVSLASFACGHGSGPRRIPKKPPATLQPMAKQGIPDGGFYFGEGRAVSRGPCGIPLAVSPAGLLKPGGAALIQERLVERGLLHAGAYAPGKLDEPTLKALIELERQERLPPVGLPNYAVVEALGIGLEEVFLSGQSTCADAGS